nr:DUF1549 and DUF1553 domain-containing protein [Catenovulum sediminis]
MERLLSSEKFGERIGRKWLDLARYSDSSGFESDDNRLNMWRYRDYVINAFNQNKPYDKFVMEQIAGDELWPEAFEANIATGFLANYQDMGSFRDLLLRKYDIEIEMSEQVAETFLAASLGCARCHDHKYDKISQNEYFGFHAFFANSAAFEELEISKENWTVWDQQYQTQKQKYDRHTKELRDQQTQILDKVRVDGLKWRRLRYFANARESLYKPEEEITPLDVWVIHRANFIEVDAQIMRYLRASADETHKAYDEKNIPLWNEYDALQQQVVKYDHLKPKKGSPYYTVVRDLSAEAPETYLRFGGIHERPTTVVEPGLPKLWAKDYDLKIEPMGNSTGRRSALAKWIASKDNPITARVFVNRVWELFFEKGISVNTADFGKAGTAPSNLKLLDHIAYEFMDNNWDVKWLVKTILLSKTYRQVSDYRKDVYAIDSENKLLAVFPRKRLEAEQIRDSLLYVSGKLNQTVGGPAVFPKIPEAMAQGNKYWNNKAGLEDNYRRSVYTFIRRSLPFALTSAFDPADSNAIHHNRVVSTTALQALTLMNSHEVFELTKALSGKIINDVGFDKEKMVKSLFYILFGREPDPVELNSSIDFLQQQTLLISNKAWDGEFSINVPSGLDSNEGVNPLQASAFVDLVHVLASSNEFIYRM